MPSRNVVKDFVEGGFYHIYNRGINKQHIFSSKKDYHVFLSYIREYLLPLPPDKANILSPSRIRKNYNESIKLLAYCLMPNHIHLLVHQLHSRSLSSFMQSVTTRYTRYFNKQYNRIGPLVQGTYKAVLIQNDEQLLQVSRYIHRNPSDIVNPLLEHENFLCRQPSSYPVYIGLFNQVWVDMTFIMSHFKNAGADGYQKFVEDSDYGAEERMAFSIKEISLDGDYLQG